MKNVINKLKNINPLNIFVWSTTLMVCVFMITISVTIKDLRSSIRANRIGIEENTQVIDGIFGAIMDLTSMSNGELKEFISDDIEPELNSRFDVLPVSMEDINNKKVKYKYPLPENVSELRDKKFGKTYKRPIPIVVHTGGKMLDGDKVMETIHGVLGRMPNLKTTNDFKLLLFETAVVETGLGHEKWSTGIKKWKNYGMMQFIIGSAKDTLNWLKKVRPDAYDEVVKLMHLDGVPEKFKGDLLWNITNNIPFSIAMAAQYYWRVCPDLYLHIGTMEQRALMWKVYYNTHKGLGTIMAYVNRIDQYYRTIDNKNNIASI